MLQREANNACRMINKYTTWPADHAVLLLVCKLNEYSRDAELR